MPCQPGPGEPAAVTRGRKQIVVMLGTVVLFFFACLLPFKVRLDCSSELSYAIKTQLQTAKAPY